METKDKDQIEQASDTDTIRTVTLDHPIKRGDTLVTTVTIRKPFGPALKGLSLAKLVNEADHDAYFQLIPRITEPRISPQDINSGALDPSDLLQIIMQVTDFFIPSKVRSQMPETPAD